MKKLLALLLLSGTAHAGLTIDPVTAGMAKDSSIQTVITNQTNKLQKTQITDGISSAAVKPAFTAPTTSDPALVVGISPNSPISVTAVPPTDQNVMSTITAQCPTGISCAPGSTVQLKTAGFGTLGFETHGTWSAVIVQDVSFDPACDPTPNSAIWYPTGAFATLNNTSLYITSWGPSLNDYPWVMNIAGAQCARLRASSFTSGIVDVTLDAGVSVAATWAVATGNNASGSADQGNPVKIGGVYHGSAPTFSDGNRGDLQIDVNGNLKTSPLLPPGASTSGNQTNGSQKTQIVDGSGNVITSTTQSGHQALDVNTYRTWTLSNSGDSVTAFQGGSWTTGRTWSLLNTTDSVNAVQSGVWTVGRSWNLGSSTDSVTSRLQDGTGNAITSQTNGAQRALDVGINVAGVQVDPRSRTWTLNNSGDSVTSFQGGTWTVQPGNTANTTPWLMTINQGGNSATVTGANALKVDGSAVTQPVSQATASNLNAQVVGNVASAASDSGNPVKTGGVFNTTQPTVTTGQRVDTQMTSRGAQIVATGVDALNVNNVTGTVSLPTNAAQETGGHLASIDGKLNSLGQKTMANSVPVVIASDQSSVAVTAAQATASNLNAQVVGNVASGSADSGNPVKAGGIFNSTLPTFTNGQRGDLQIAARGGLIVSGGVADGSTPVQNSIGVSGIDGGGLKRTLLTDTSGNLGVIGSVADAATDSGNPVKTGGVFNTTQPTYTNGQRANLQLNQFGSVSTMGRFKFKSFSGAATTTVKSGSGTLHSVCVGSGGGGFSVTVYDNTTNSGTVITTINNIANGTVACQDLDVEFSTGLTVVTAGASNTAVVTYY